MLCVLLGFGMAIFFPYLNKILKIKGKHFVVEVNFTSCLCLKTLAINVSEKTKAFVLVAGGKSS
jgi:hypothetical protein